MNPRCLVIPAAGLGTRMKSVDPNLPKELLPIASKSAIEFTIEEGIDAGVEQVVIIISRKKEIIRERLSKVPLPITFLYQEEPLGESDAIALAEPIVGDRPLAIIYPDNLYLPAPGVLRLLQEAYKQHDTDVIALSAVTQANAMVTGNSGRVDLNHQVGDMYRIQRFYPKGAGHFIPRFNEEFRACGIMVFGPHIFEAIRRTRDDVDHGEFTDEPVRKLILKERGLLGLRVPGTVLDIGNPMGYSFCLSLIGSFSL